VAAQLLEDYDKQLQTLKTMVEKIMADYDEWEKDNSTSTNDASSRR
jgi:hypothetical protein